VLVHGEAERARLDLIRNVRLGVDEKIARDSDDPFIRPAAGRRRQLWLGSVCDVYANHGEIAIVEFPNVGTPIATDALRAVGVWVLADTS
jgi:hypothetical protein